MSDLPDVSVAALRRLARGLVYDRHGAEDVVQEAWLAALRVRPPAERLGAWLGAAVRNLAANKRREEARRARRERAAARPEATRGADESAEHIETLRRLLDALERLEPPYRAAVVLRYLEDEPPRAIARRLGLPVNTARTHVRRGLERLRRDLDGERGEGRQSSLAALVPLAGGAPWALALGGGTAAKGSLVLVMQKKIALAAVLLALVGLSYLVARSGGSGDARAGRAEAELAESAPSETPAAPATVETTPHERSLATRREAPPSAAPAPGTWVVRGRALRRGRDPFPGLALACRLWAGSERKGEPLVETRLRAGEDGAFEWPLEPPTELVTVEVAPVADGCILYPTWDVFVPGDEPPQRWSVTADPLDCTVRGRVLDPDGRPLAGARVRERDRVEEQEAETDSDGRYALRIAGGRDFRIRFRAAGFAQRTLALDAARGTEVAAPDVVLAPELVVRGRVVDEDGRPVEGAEVEPGYPFFGAATTSDARGEFEVGTIDAAVEHLSLEARKPGYADLQQFLPPEERGAPVELVLLRGARVTGRVLDPGGAPVYGACVLVGWSPAAVPIAQTYSARDGGFALENVPSGGQRVWALRTGFAQAVAAVDVPAGAREVEVELALEAQHHVGGIVLDERGEPLEWALVYAEDPLDGRSEPSFDAASARSGPDGRFRLDGLPAKPITLGAIAGGRARVEQRVEALDRDDLVIRMPRSAALAGRVLDAATGAPIPAFVVRVGIPPAGELAIDSMPAAWSRGVAFSDPDGEWRLEHSFEPGRLATLTIEAEGYAPAEIADARTALDPDPSALVVRLVSGTRVRGRVVERASGAPIAGARVRRAAPDQQYSWLDGEDVPETRTDAQGRFELVDVPTGSALLFVDHPDWIPASDGPFEVGGGAAPERWIELGRGATVRGRLLDARGAGVAGESVSLSCLEGIERARDWRATTDADGRYELSGLPPGTYHARWLRRLDGVEVYDLLRLVELDADEVFELDLAPRGRATVKGTLESEVELPPVVKVFVFPERPRLADGSFARWSDGGRAGLAQGGSFRLTDVEPGRCRVLAFAELAGGGDARGSVDVDVPESGELDVRIRLDRQR